MNVEEALTCARDYLFRDLVAREGKGDSSASSWKLDVKLENALRNSHRRLSANHGVVNIAPANIHFLIETFLISHDINPLVKNIRAALPIAGKDARFFGEPG